MNPSYTAHAEVVKRIPRVSGGESNSVTDTCHVTVYSPRERGVNLYTCSFCYLSICIPRMSGGEPSMATDGFSAMKYSPRERG